jgi:hypothetical protein
MQQVTIGAPPPPATERRALTLRWEISPHALRASRLPDITAMNGQAEKIGRAMLEWCVEDRSASARLVLEIGEDDVIVGVAQTSGRWINDSGDGFEHADFGAALHLTLRDGRPVWARTDIFDRVLGLRGGVYEGPLA